MAEQIHISPGVFTREIDQTLLQEGVAGIGAAVIGATQKGPAFQSINVSNWVDFEAKFGILNPNMYAPYAAKEYLKNQTVLNVIRVLGIHSTDYAAGNIVYDAFGHYATEPAGFTASNGIAICNSGANDGWEVATIVHSNVSLTATGTLQSLVVDFASGYNSGNPFTASYISGDRNYVEKVLSTDSTQYVTPTIGHYIWTNYAYNSASLGNATRFSGSMVLNTVLSFSQEYSTPATSWIYSQNFGANQTIDTKTYRLFRIILKDDGAYGNDNIKITCTGIRSSLNSNVSEFGYFNIIVRKFYDNDKKQEIIEQFTECTLNADDTVGYVARKIGDKRVEWDSVTKKFIERGEFDSKSNYIRVELDEQVSNKAVPESALPWGFYGYTKYASASFPVWSSGSTHHYATVPSLPYIPSMKWQGDYDKRICWGVAFNDVSGNINYGIADRMKVLPIGVSSENDRIFSLDFLSSTLGPITASGQLNTDSDMSKLNYSYQAGNVSASVLLGTNAAKFTLPVYGGFDGFNIHYKNPIDNSLLGAGDQNNATSAWNTSYYPWSYEIASLRRAVDVISDPEQIDLNLLVIPGIFHPSIVNYTIQKVEDRADVFYIMDISGSTTANVTEWIDEAKFDTSYAAAYYPFVKYFDEINNKDVWLPPSISAFGAFAYNDRISFQWFAPAGFTRASINAKDVRDKLNYTDRNTLYSKNINPIAKFPQEGIVIWGQKTLQAKVSALSSINVRRLMIYLRKTIASAAAVLVFEPNIATTWQRFVKLVQPILDDVFRKYGIEQYKILMDATTTTPQMIEQLRMAGRIYIIPTRASEAIDLPFIISPQGADFS